MQDFTCCLTCSTHQEVMAHRIIQFKSLKGAGGFTKHPPLPEQFQGLWASPEFVSGRVDTWGPSTSPSAMSD